jgi:tetraacyldisaccharide 4'-kinase
MKLASEVWNSEAGWAVLSRALLVPAALLYRAGSGMRNAMYDRGLLPIAVAPIPVISIGNLAVGGTGKTPVSAWMAAELSARGARPAIVMRGYGDDEPGVHALLNPGIPVVAKADRIAAVQDAATAGADVAVLDDGFQHRRLSRLEDVVLVSADRWHEPIRVLPSGPWRELPAALSRASMVMVTRKAADAPRAGALLQRLAPMTRTGAGAVAVLELGDLRHVVTGAARPLSDIRGTGVLAAAGIGDPASLASQLRETGASVDLRRFPDHHVYDSSDIAQLAHDARNFDHVICTLKDAVKLRPRWPREAPPLWYVSLRCRIEIGSADVSAMLDRVLAARPTHIRQARTGQRLHDT